MANLEEFIDRPTVWGSPVEIERRNRILLAFAAYAYEFDSNSIMSDAEFDELCRKIDPTVSTVGKYHTPEEIRRCTKLDKFWREEFSPSTGQWIQKHPELARVSQIYYHYHKKEKDINILLGP